MKKDELELRKAIIAKCRWMNAAGLNQGTAGNISVRYKDRMLITPSAVPYDEIEPEMIAAMPIEGEYGAWKGPLKPSTEWRFHLDILRARPDVGAIVHTHATFSTVLAIAHKPIPACHYMVAAFGGTDVRVAPYATYGTKDLSDNALAALKDRNGCLLANHGMIAVGPSLDKAMWLAHELETLAKQYFHSLLIGGPVVLADAEIFRVKESFKGYGLQDKPLKGEGKPSKDPRKPSQPEDEVSKDQNKPSKGRDKPSKIKVEALYDETSAMQATSAASEPDSPRKRKKGKSPAAEPVLLGGTASKRVKVVA
jgi:L-fuculose-phosphate aldolase